MPYDESKSRLFARPLTHPDVAHLEAIIEDNRRNCASIDRALRPNAYINRRVRHVAPTLHDLATSNPLLRAMLKDLQK
jgi:hypothetical protein